MSPSKLIAARDPHGFRPLCIGVLERRQLCVCLRDLRAGRASARRSSVTFDAGRDRVVDRKRPAQHDHCDTSARPLRAYLSISISPVRTPIIDGSAVQRCRVRRPASICPSSIRSARTSSSACPTRASRRRSATRTLGHPVRRGSDQEPLYWPYLYPTPVRAERERSVRLKLNALRTAIEGQARHHGRRLDRSRHDLRPSGQAAARRQARPRSICAFLRPRSATPASSAPTSPAARANCSRTTHHGGGDARDHRRGFARLPVARGLPQDRELARLRLLRCVLLGRVPHPVPDEAEKNMFEMEIPLGSKE